MKCPSMHEPNRLRTDNLEATKLDMLEAATERATASACTLTDACNSLGKPMHVAQIQFKFLINGHLERKFFARTVVTTCPNSVS